MFPSKARWLFLEGITYDMAGYPSFVPKNDVISSDSSLRPG